MDGVKSASVVSGGGASLPPLTPADINIFNLCRKLARFLICRRGVSHHVDAACQSGFRAYFIRILIITNFICMALFVQEMTCVKCFTLKDRMNIKIILNEMKSQLVINNSRNENKDENGMQRFNNKIQYSWNQLAIKVKYSILKEDFQA